MSEACFTAADILLPAAGVPLNPWACIAVDQFTSQPEYWQRAEQCAADKPSTLHIVLPEAYLGTPQEEERLQSIRRTMEEYRRTVLTRKVHGYVYVERTQMDGTVRQGLVGAVDLEAYDYTKGAKPAIRPSESTVVERIPPRLKVRRGATLETPHVMMLADDADCTLIEPIGLAKDSLPLLYDGELMLGGGRLRGWAVEDPALIAQIDTALAALADPDAFARRWPAAKGQVPMVLAVGDGNHSLATAKAYWEELKPTLTEEQRKTHPARWCLAEVCNVHSPAIEIEPIHRVVFGVSAKELYAALDAWDQKQGSSTTMSDQRLRLADAYGESAVALANLTGTIQAQWAATLISFGLCLPLLVEVFDHPLGSAWKRFAEKCRIYPPQALPMQVLNSAILSITLVLPISSLMYRRRLPVGEQFRQYDIPFCVLMALILLLPPLVKKRLYRWQGRVCLILYVMYLAAVLIMPRAGA